MECLTFSEVIIVSFDVILVAFFFGVVIGFAGWLLERKK